MKQNIFLLLTIISFNCFADTIYVSSKTDPRLLAYKDTVYAYETGKSISNNMAIIFQELSGSHDYDSYFLDAWTGAIQFNQRVDTLLGYTEFLPNTQLPDKTEKLQFASNTSVGEKIVLQFTRLDTIKITPFAKVVGSEMPDVYIYRKPTRVVLYKKLDKCWEKKMLYTTLDMQTHFIVNNMYKTCIPYNIRRHYQVKDNSSILIKTEWVDPTDQNKIIKTVTNLNNKDPH
mgnify:CR=1 FL=1